MGLHINLQHASWLAHILKPSGSVPPLKDEGGGAQREVLNQFLQQIENDFYSGVGHERLWREEIAGLCAAKLIMRPIFQEIGLIINFAAHSKQPTDRNLQRLGNRRDLIIHQIAGVRFNPRNRAAIEQDSFRCQPTG
jgi:hypothetical protein